MSTQTKTLSPQRGAKLYDVFSAQLYRLAVYMLGDKQSAAKAVTSVFSALSAAHLPTADDVRQQLFSMLIETALYLPALKGEDYLAAFGSAAEGPLLQALAGCSAFQRALLLLVFTERLSITAAADIPPDSILTSR